MESKADSSNFPWLQNVKSRISNPIDQIDDFDKRVAISDLMEEHMEKLEQLKNGLQSDPLYKPSRHDRFWLLRFLLSHKCKVKTALAAAKSTLIFRQEHDLDSFDIRHLDVNDRLSLQQVEGSHPYCKQLQLLLECCETNTFISYLPDHNRDMVSIIHIAGRNQAKMITQMNEQVYLQAMIIFAEWILQWLDCISRQTGRLTKNVRIVDLEGAKMSMINMQVYEWEGRNSRLMIDKFPQLLGSVFIVNPPFWMAVVFKMLKILIPKRVLEKIAFIDPNGNQQDLKRCLQSCRKSCWPRMYGGDLEEWPPITWISGNKCVSKHK